MSSTQQLLLGEGAGGGAVATYIEDVFSTYLYTGNGSTQTITNGIDLSTKGGLVWIKRRNGVYSHVLYDTSRGVNLSLSSNTTGANVNQAPDGVSAFNATGFSLNGNSHLDNNTTGTYASWTFREQAKFFDVVTFSTTTSSTVPITVNHNLGSVPGCIIVKQTNGAADWFVYHRSRGSTKYLTLNSADAEQNGGTSKWYATPTSTAFTLGGDFVQNATYVAYLYAHDAGGFGLTGADNVISCGSYTEGSSDVTVSLGYEPAWILVKPSSTTGNWNIYDAMRGAALTGNTAVLRPNTSDAEAYPANYWYPTSTGFVAKSGNYGSGQTIIYIAIRRGPMKVPTSGTSVFSPVAYTGNGGTQNLTTGFAGDMAWIDQRTDAGQRPQSFDKLRGNNVVIYQSSTSAEQTNSPSSYTVSFNNTQTVLVGPYSPGGIYNNSGSPQIAWNFQRAPSFFDEVCYIGNDTNRTLNHNLGVAPEMMIVKSRVYTVNWAIYHSGIGPTKSLYFTSGAQQSYGGFFWNDTAPTSSVFSLGTDTPVNSNNTEYVAYLFATCPGVSKVGSYTGTGTTQQINCGFTGGARFVLIKRADSTGDWYVWDSARGIVAGNDPYLLLNSTAAEVTNTDYVDTYSAGFEISSTAPAAINANGGTFIFLAIA